MDFVNFFDTTPDTYRNLRSCCFSFRIAAINNIPVVFFGEFHEGYVDGNVMNMVNGYLPYIYFRCGRQVAPIKPARICLFLELDARNSYCVADDKFTKGFGSTLHNMLCSPFYNNKELRKAFFPDLKIIYSDFADLLEQYVGYSIYNRHGDGIAWNTDLVKDVDNVFKYIFNGSDTFDINRHVLLTKYVSSLKKIFNTFNVNVQKTLQSLYKKIINNLKIYTTEALWYKRNGIIEVIFMRLRDLNLFMYFLKSLFKQRYALYLFWVGGGHIRVSFDFFLSQFATDNIIETKTLYDSPDNYTTNVFPMYMLENLMETYVFSKFLNRQHFNKHNVLQAMQTAIDLTASLLQDEQIKDNDEETSHSAKNKKRKRKDTH